MIFNTSGGGGAALNFRVVGGTTAPSNPSENCIWVNTSVPFTNWVFSADEPSPAEAGMVWIISGTSSQVAFNALKKNCIQVYPISAKQYVSGAWVDKTAKSYQNGAWADWYVWDGELFDNGEQYEDVTGGWVCTASSQTAGTISDGKIIIGNSQSLRTANAINNCGKYTKLCCQVDSVSGQYHTMIITKTPHNYSTGGYYGEVSVKSGLNYMDISAIDEDFYVDFLVARASGSMTVSKVWME